MLTQARLKELLLFDDAAGRFVWRLSGRKHIAGEYAGCIKPHGYEMIGIDYARYYSHRLVWLYHHGEWPRSQIDHINGNRSDNRIINLREASHTENQRNRGRQKNNHSGTNGVHWASREQRWIAKIKVHQKTRQIGAFLEKNEAIAARKAAETKLFGQYARKES
jgi:hypothetical protein